MTVMFHSTRGQSPGVDIRGAALAGLAPDGGLYVPVAWPPITPMTLALMRGESYTQIAFRVLQPFMESVIPDNVLRDIIEKSYSVFDRPDVTPLVDVGDLKILELFHGPTLAFKDIALQFLGHVLEYFLRDATYNTTIIGATSGDTGSAAIAALANRKNIDVFILYPQKGPSDIQRKQMTCVGAPNIHAIAVDGTFDDCQAMVKNLFADKNLCNQWNLSTVNSINMLRILAQMVYYFYAASRVDTPPSFVVPTGNFGDIYAAYAAEQSGLSLGRLVVACNSNDILTRFFLTGRMSSAPVKTTLSPSMDIQMSSNFERLLFDMCGKDSTQLRRLMDDLKNKGHFSVTEDQLNNVCRLFVPGSVNDEETLATIMSVYETSGYVMDPHTAVGVKVAQTVGEEMLTWPVICLATAHPAKFPETVHRAVGITPSLPPQLAALLQQPEHIHHLPADINALIAFMKEHKK
jgi:threonine synthase